MLGVQNIATYAKTTELWNSYRWRFVWSFQASRQSVARWLISLCNTVSHAVWWFTHWPCCCLCERLYKCMLYSAKPLINKNSTWKYRLYWHFKGWSACLSYYIKDDSDSDKLLKWWTIIHQHIILVLLFACWPSFFAFTIFNILIAFSAYSILFTFNK